jgi:hypothetical protein
MSQWHIPSHDTKNENKYMYKIHTIDLYFWTTEDSNLFLDSIKRVVHESQLRILDAPAGPVEHRDTMSPVVQKLEQAAISKPYQGRNQKANDSTNTTQSYNGLPATGTSSIGASGASPPPPSAASTEFKPMAYNPAAPAAPEPIAHREPTPPPPDAESGTGLTGAALNDQNPYLPHSHQHQGSFPQSTANQPYIPGPPQRTGSFPPPPPMTGTPPVQRTSNLPPPPPGGPGTPSHSMSFAPPPKTAQESMYSSQPVTQYANYTASSSQPLGSPGFPSTPGTAPLQSPGYPPVHSPGHAPPGGFSNYSYNSNQIPSASNHDIHSQVYRPTEHEANSHVKPANPNQPPGGFEQRVDKLEKGMGRFLKKLDKKF